MSSAAEQLPEFRRATPEDAVVVAAALFDDGQRVDMQTVADRLGISRATLYRWIGDRDQLIDRVAARAARRMWEQARSEAEGVALEHFLDAARRFLELAVGSQAAVQFAQRESVLALHIFLDPESRVASRLRRALSMQMREDVPEHTIPEEMFAMLGLSATALVWANVATGHPPQVEATVTLMREVLRAQLPPGADGAHALS